MIDDPNISPQEKKRRLKVSKIRKKMIKERREKGYRAWLRKRRAEIRRRKKAEAKEKEKEKKRREKEREKAKHKRRVGRPRKPGPKKKRKKKIIKPPRVYKRLPPFNYKIVSCRNGIQNGVIGKFRYIEDAYKCLDELKNESGHVIFDAQVSGVDSIENAIDEYLLIEKKENEENEPVLLRNEYGKLVEQKTNTDKWQIVDKIRYRREETFWVWGYDKRTDRKTFLWIYENIITEGVETSLFFKRFILYKNKIVIKDDDGNIDLIVCKGDWDAVRFYNLTEEWSKRDGIGQILFCGNYASHENMERKRQLEEEISKLTGWPIKKVQMKNPTYYISGKLGGKPRTREEYLKPIIQYYKDNGRNFGNNEKKDENNGKAV